MSEEQAPRRRYDVRVRVGADEWADALRELRRLVDHLEEHGPACNSISGGPATGHIVDVRVDETMTHERYHAELRAYLEMKRSAGPA